MSLLPEMALTRLLQCQLASCRKHGLSRGRWRHPLHFPMSHPRSTSRLTRICSLRSSTASTAWFVSHTFTILAHPFDMDVADLQ